MILKRNSHGLTLIEMIISIGILTAFLAGMFAFFRSQVFAFRSEETRVRLKESTDVALDFIVKEIRMAGSRPNDPPFDAAAGTGGYPPAGCAVAAATADIAPGCGDSTVSEPASFHQLTVATTTSITLQYDYRGALETNDPDGCPDDADELIAYTYDAVNDTIDRNGVTLLENVPTGGFQLLYFDRDGAALTSPLNTETIRASVSRIELSLTANSIADPFLPGNVVQNRTNATIFLRNPPC